MSSEPRRWYRRRIVLVAGAVAVVLICAAAVFALTRPGDVFNSDVEFRSEPQETSVPTPEATTRKPKKKKRVDPLAGFQWPQYGYSRDRRRYLPTDPKLLPPFRQRWEWDAPVLLEFSPIIVGNRLFLTRNDGVVVALNRTTGKVVWRKDLGYLAASSPAYGNKKIVVTILERTKGSGGRIVGIWAKSGKTSWSKTLDSRTESSPVISDGRAYFGTEGGDIYAMRVSNGSVAWKVGTGGAVKGGVALFDGKVFVGTYGGNVYALSQRSGHQVWHTGTRGANFGLSAGNFYATPAVAFGRVYIGNTDGNMYSFSAASGRLAWRRSTGSYVYASPAVAQVPGGQPTVYFGSYDGTFYALDARSGSTRWTYRDGGTISGGATVIGRVVYFANRTHTHTLGLGARSGDKVFETGRGAYNPVVSNGQEIYLTGYSSLVALEPLTAAQERARAKRQAKKKALERKRKAAKRRAAKRKRRKNRR